MFRSEEKLDGVGPVDNRPSTNKLHHFVQKSEHSLKISAPYLLPFVIYDIMKIWRKRMTRLIIEWINHEAVCRTAPATPGLLKT